MSTHINEIVNLIRNKYKETPTTGIILGSGLGCIAKYLEEVVKFSYDDILGYSRPNVEGHAGELLLGRLSSEKIIIANGRFHLYEGFDLETVTLPIELFHDLGVKNLIITNSAGSVRKENGPGTFIALAGHIDCTFQETNDFPTISNSEVYHSPKLLNIALEVARHSGIKLVKGVYAWTLGPSYETPAEIEFFKELGADAVGMSTVPEIRAASDLGMNIITISCLTNYAAGVVRKPITHKDVIAVASENADELSLLLKQIILKIKDVNEY